MAKDEKYKKSTIPYDVDSSAYSNNAYQDIGRWARHFSTVRLSVATFFLSTTVAILAVQWDQSSSSLAWVAAGYLSIGFVVFVGFSFATAETSMQQAKMRNAFIDYYAGKKKQSMEKLETELEGLQRATPPDQAKIDAVEERLAVAKNLSKLDFKNPDHGSPQEWGRVNFWSTVAGLFAFAIVYGVIAIFSNNSSSSTTDIVVPFTVSVNGSDPVTKELILGVSVQDNLKAPDE